jgi:hypothetical protein
MKQFRFALLALAVLTAGACRGSGPLEPTERRALDSARERWEARRPTEYTYEGRVFCFCDPAISVWTVIRVRGETVVSATPLLVTPSNGTPVAASAWRTVTGLFEVIQNASSAEYTRDVVATFDDQFGYPTSINVRCHENIADCGAVYEARNLRAVP